MYVDMLEQTVLKACGVQGMQGFRWLDQKPASSSECMKSPADSERLSDSQRRLSIIRETPDKAALERSSPAEGRVKGGGAALNSLSQTPLATPPSGRRSRMAS